MEWNRRDFESDLENLSMLYVQIYCKQLETLKPMLTTFSSRARITPFYKMTTPSTAFVNSDQYFKSLILNMKCTELFSEQENQTEYYRFRLATRLR